MFVYTGMIGVYDFFRAIKLLREEICGRFILSLLLGSGPTRRGRFMAASFPRSFCFKGSFEKASLCIYWISKIFILKESSHQLWGSERPQFFMKQLKYSNHDILRRKDPTHTVVSKKAFFWRRVWGSIVFSF